MSPQDTARDEIAPRQREGLTDEASGLTQLDTGIPGPRPKRLIVLIYWKHPRVNPRAHWKPVPEHGENGAPRRCQPGHIGFIVRVPYPPA
jgi:hypothetical protein